jgi:hypothetical protein
MAHPRNDNASHLPLNGAGSHHSMRSGFIQALPPGHHLQQQHQQQLPGQRQHQYQYQQPQSLQCNSLRPITNTSNTSRPQTRVPENAFADLLPYCTMEPPLNQEQVIALSDVVGSLKELVVLVLGASAGDVACVEKLEGAVGTEIATKIVEFFVDEWEME